MQVSTRVFTKPSKPCESSHNNLPRELLTTQQLFIEECMKHNEEELGLWINFS